MKKIVVGCDNAAVELKNTLVAHMREKGLNVEDVGCMSEKDPIYYPYIAQTVCNIITESNFEKQGVLICGTGIGMAMTANKFKGIRAAVCHDIFSAERAKLSNNTNIICMGERVIGKELAKRLLDKWLDLDFKNGNSSLKLEVIKKIEDDNMR